MPITAYQVLNRAINGTTLVFKDHVIAEITAKSNGRIEIQDIHGKGWRINPNELTQIDYKNFLNALSKSIIQAAPKERSEGSAQARLLNLKVGDSLEHKGFPLGTKVAIRRETEFGPIVSIHDSHDRMHEIYIDLLPNLLSYSGYLQQFKRKIEDEEAVSSLSRVAIYFKEEFSPKLIGQIAYEQECWGDTWMMPPPEGQEASLRKRIIGYFDLFEQFGKDVPWIKIAYHAIIAQAREDHPEWLL